VYGLTLGSALDANSLKVESLAAHTANGDSVRFEHTTITPIEHAAGSVGTTALADNAVTADKITDGAVTAAKLETGLGVELAVGNYAGDDAATQAITGSGVDLTSGTWLLRVLDRDDARDFWKTSDMGVNSRSKKSDAVDYQADMLISGDADGFTVGTTNNVNASGHTYDYIIWKTA